MRNTRIRTWSVLLSLAVGVGWAVMAAGPAAAGGGCHVPLTDRSGVAVNASDLCFTPTVIRVPVGGAVTWTNDDSTEHTVTGVGGAWGSYDVLGPGDTVAHDFPASGVYPYYCAIHPGMAGAVVVGDGRPGTTAAGAGAPPASVQPSAAAAVAAPAGQASSSDVWRSVVLVALAVLVAGTVVARRRRTATGRAERHPAA